MNKHKSMYSAAGILGFAVFIGGCASTGERPDSQLQTAESAIQQAVSSDARDFEPVLLNQAQNKVADAEKLIETEDYREAARLLEQASVDAQLAGARSDTAKAQQAVEEINGNIETLRQRLQENQ
jgi:phosphotransacetylase